MGYYLRAFCTSAELPPLRVTFDWAASQRVQLELAPGSDTPLDAADWREAEISYRSDRQPLEVDVSRAGEELLSEEIEEFVEFLEDVPESPDKDKVLRHLAQTRAVVAVRLLGDAEEEGASAASTFLAFFVDNAGGLIQADGEGFFEGERLIAKVE